LDLLKKHLRSVVDHCHQAQIVIVDDASTDGSVAWIKQRFPQITVIVNSQNLGFTRSVNRGVKALNTDLFLLLNSDVSINQFTIPRLTNAFKNPNVFAVGALEQLPKSHRRGKSTGSFKRGMLIHAPARPLTSGPTLWVFGASGMFRRRLWQNLGGFDPLFRPAYWEDIDLGYRAWKAGYLCLFEPKATVEHDGEATMTQALGYKKTAIAFKNQLLFFWKNITSIQLILAHLAWTPYHLVITSIKTKGAFTWGFLLALRQLFEVNSQVQAAKPILSDLEIIDQLTKQVK